MFFTGGSAIGEQPVCPDNISGQTGIFLIMFCGSGVLRIPYNF